MEELFTIRAQAVLRTAVSEAEKRNDEYVGTEHLLAALLIEGGLVATVLNNLRVNIDGIHYGIQRLTQPKQDTGSAVIHLRRLPLSFTPALNRVFSFAADEAKPSTNGGRLADEGDLLVGLMSNGVASELLINQGVKLQALRDELGKLRGSQVETEPP